MPIRLERKDFCGTIAVFASEPMRRVFEMVEQVAPSNATILITGESGCGKEVIAKAVHHYSSRADKPWVDVNCGAIPENLLESELFGHEKGAFSGADSAKPGLFELAHGGTLFLDEIGELDLRLQVKLLRVLDGSAYYRVGGTKKISTDVRLVAATNQDLKAAIEDGHFRSDLFHRLSQIPIKVPPLRNRRDDIAPLALHYLASEKPGLHFSEEALAKLGGYSWPGNVRELRNVVIRAAILSKSAEIGVSDLPEEISAAQFAAGLHTLAGLHQAERGVVLTTLEEVGGHRQRAADRLGISKRTLQRRLKEYDLPRE